ncbi:MAG: DUF3078 domain-containing protein [Candidatus Zixiibacteriota bacterium]
MTTNTFRGKIIGATLLMFAFSLSELSATTDSTKAAWKKSLIVDITTTQTTYSDSWVGGEAGSFNWVGNLNGFVEKKIASWMELKSTLKLSFGQTLTQDAENKRWSKPSKSTDLIDWENVGRFTIDWFVDPYAAFRAETQFFDGSVREKRRYFSPLKLTESAGFTRKFYEKDKDFITSRLGLGIRQTIKSVIIDSVKFTTEDSTLVDGGFESVTDVSITFNEKLSYTGKLTLYKAIYFSKQNEVKGTYYEDDWKAIDVNWENIISASPSKIVTVNLYTQLLYDKEVSRRGRFKETLAIGFVFKML